MILGSSGPPPELVVLVDFKAIYPGVLVMSTISKRKQKRSNIEAYYWNESKTFWFGPLKIGTEAERFGLVRIFLYQKQFFSVLAHRFWDGANQFDLVCLFSELKQNILIWSAYYRK